MVLVGRDRNEGRLGEDVSAEGRVLGAEAVVLVRLHDVDPRLVLVHRIQDDLEEREKKSGDLREKLEYMSSHRETVKTPRDRIRITLL